MKRIIGLILLLFSSALCLSQVSDRKFAIWELDGKYWTGQSTVEREVLVRRFATLKVMQIDLANVRPELAQGIENVRPADPRIFPDSDAYRAGIDAVYSDPANLPMRVWRAYDYVELKSSGASESVLAEYLANAKKVLK